MIIHPRKKEMLESLALMVEHAAILGRACLRWPEDATLTGQFETQVGVVEGYKRRIKALST